MMGIGGEGGRRRSDSENPVQYELFSHNSLPASHLAAEDSFVSSRAFAPALGFCQRNGIRNGTQRTESRDRGYASWSPTLNVRCCAGLLPSLTT